MRIPSGTTDQVIFFVAVDATDLKTRETGLTTFTVYRARDTNAAAAMTTPTVAELSAANMPGVYSLLLDEDMTITSGNDSEEMVFHITQASMAPVTRSIELYRPKITAGNTLDVTATGAAGIDLANVENQGSTLGLTATTVAAVTTLTTYTGNTPQTGDSFARLGAPAGASVSADLLAIDNFVDGIESTLAAGVTVATNNDKTGYSLTATTGLGNQTSNITGNLSGSVGSVTGAVGSVTGAVGSVTGAVGSVTGNVGGNVTGSIGSLAAQAKLDVNAEVDTAVTDLLSGIILGAAATGTLSTTQATTNLTGYADDQLIGRVIIWLTGACEGEATDITDYASASGLITFTALTTAPANTDTFKIV